MEGGDKAFNQWNSLEDQVTDPKDPEQVWDTIEQSFEQSTSFLHFHDVYLADFRQDLNPRVQVQEGRQGADDQLAVPCHTVL